MKLTALLKNSAIVEWIGPAEQEIVSIQFDSRKIASQTLFVAQTGTLVDGHDFVESSIESGAVAIVCERKPEVLHPEITYVLVRNAAIALGEMASIFYGNPTRKLKLIGITGTNGKTTTATLTYHLLESLGFATVLVSTIRTLIHGVVYPSSHTTPDILTLNKIFSEAVEKGCAYAVMEVSSHGIHQHRIAGLHFEIGAFTNITHDHLDYHHTFKEYLSAKKMFFDALPKTAKSLINMDDKNGVVMVQNTASTKYSYALKTTADFKAKVIENQLDGMQLLLDGKEFWTPLIGEFNAYNLLNVYSIARLLDFDAEEILMHLSQLKNVDGRFQSFITASGISIIIDYAHTPDALENVLKTIAKIRTRNERLFTVVGCGGDRDKSKRPKMAKIAAEQSDFAILTSDNPRSEDPEQILKDMEVGVMPQDYKKTLKITDRREAIKTAFQLAEKGDILLIAGKGHENYQEIKGVKHPFDDMEIAIELSKQLNK
ncbi:MAG TPA: UDP-N-acetylmuramoyl-L-alanyl-D-glutamate--2,6-diaminopimelate ligase [Moheibacter sp.]|nr:UDP-N-acetylmuramoyl-L-alanyl-D-glutamate--2,6-diaminopimelate ligase [Moheibacter sp.]